MITATKTVGMSESLLFGAWLKQRRRVLDLTQAELARQSTCATESIRKIEAGALKPSRGLALHIALALHVPAAEHEPFVTFARSSQQMAPADAFRAHPHQAPSPTSAPPAAPLYTLPRPLTSFVGRVREVEAVVRLLQRPEVALVTLSGPPGAGKTRLSLAAGQRLHGDFPDGVCFVPLANVSGAHMLLPAIAQALGVQETPNQALMLTLKRYLRDKRLLLILDNFEQLVAAAPLLVELLTAAAHVKTLITSRAVLKVYGEHEFPVGPLTLPSIGPLPPPESLLGYSAVQLFVERAQAVRPGLTLTTANAGAIAQICIALDGLPLAIEMAAARIKWSGPDAVLQQLSRQLSKLATDARDLPPRQRTLRGAIDWSYDLLESGELRALMWLSVFVGGCTLEAARAILGNEHIAVTLEALVEKSLLQHELDSGGDVRFMQLEMIRDYAREKLTDASETSQARDRHLAYFVDWAEAAAPQLLGAEQATWYDRLETDHDNLRAAAQWACDSRQPAAGLRLASATWEFWIARGHQAEWLERLNDLLALPEAAAQDGPSAQARVRGLNTAGFSQLHPLLFLMTVHLCINMAIWPLLGLQLATNRVKLPGILTMVMGLANLGLALALAGPIGWNLYGIAAAGGIMLTVKNVFFTPLYAAHVLGKPRMTFFRELGLIVGVTSVSILLCRGVLWLRPITGWADLVMASLTVSVLYGLVVYRFILSGKEREIVSDLIPWRKSIGGKRVLQTNT